MSEGRFFEYVNRLIREEKQNRDGWARELSVTVRTITNFNHKLEKEYGITVSKKNSPHGHYYIDKDKNSRYDAFINFIQNLNSPTKIAESFTDRDGIGKHLIFHQDWNKVGWMKHFDTIVSVINNQQYISIKYYSFRTEEHDQFMYFMPYWMKQNAYFRWYIIGFEKNDGTFPTVIGLDKIKTINVDDKKFYRNPGLEHYKDVYENVFGVYTYENREPETIRIECTRFQAQYIKSLPLHPSQEVESENDDVAIFRYKLVINHEFAYELLRQNAWNFNPNMLEYPHPKRTAIKVLEPAWLVDYFHQTYKRSYLAYAKDLNIIHKLKRDIDEAEFPYPLPEF
jgi:hypothetical protein